MSFLPDATGPAIMADSEFDLDLVIIDSTESEGSLVWNSGTHCHTDDSCGHTCESACGPSCTDGH